MSSEVITDVQKAFESAIRRASLSVTMSDAQLMVRQAIFTLDIRNSLTQEKDALPSISAASLSDAQNLALAIRSTLEVNDMDPVFRLPDLLMAEFNVLVFTLQNERIVGACAMVYGLPLIFIGSENENESLYACARQLGYLLRIPTRTKKTCLAIIETAHNYERSPTGTYERFADSIALDLLIPTRGLGVALQQIRRLLKVSNDAIGDVELLYLSRIFGVSFFAMARKCERVKLLPKGGATALNQFMIEKFGSPEARADQLDLPPRPSVTFAPIPTPILWATANRIVSGKMTLEYASNTLGCPMTYLSRSIELVAKAN